MASIKIDITQTIEQNADAYFERAKKARKKLVGVQRAMEHRKAATKKKTVEHKQRKRFWFEQFRWFISSDEFLCIGGRDAATNELVIKKHTEPKDIVLHTDMAGSPFVVIKAEGKEIPESTIKEAAQFTASMSRAWKNGLGTLDVFYVNPDQVSKEAQAGESLGRGAFMIRGKTNYLHPEIKLAAGLREKEGASLIMVGPLLTFENKNERETITLRQGTGKPSDAAKRIKKRFPNTNDDLDAIIRQLPPGGIDC